jgi:hypothetical protein
MKNRVELSMPGWVPGKDPEIDKLVEDLRKSLEEHLERTGCLDDLDDPPTTGKEPTTLE